jgi:peroxiredoxin Q/BCP
MLRNKTAAPSFTLRNEKGEEQTLDDLRGGRPLVLFFFRGAFCPTSARDLMAYGNVYRNLRAMGGAMAAISVDGSDELKSLKQRLKLPFPLLADTDFAVSRRYGVYESDETDEGPQPHGEPAVFVLDSDGHIAYSQLQSGPKGHASAPQIALIVFYMTQHGGKYW